MSQDNICKFECTNCKTITHHSQKNKKTIKQRLELKKFCNKCKSHQMHKETK
ncbi:MAG: 50S ribosomal protein L33 [Patescibacteria group bacterium]|nr:50S ribosomal protein L33 [Patescibacteria group bacterium]